MLDLPSSDYEEDERGGRTTSRTNKLQDSDDGKDNFDEDAEDEYGGWENKEYYGGDVVETEEAAEEEEIEAKRLQQKQLTRMSEADFNLDDWVGENHEEEIIGHEGAPILERLPETQITADTPIEERLRLLQSRYPEFEPITKEFLSLQSIYHEVEFTAQEVKDLQAGQVNVENIYKRPKHPATVKWQALSAHLGAMAMYFAVLTSTASPDGTALSKPPAEIREHPIMETLLKTRQLWQRASALHVPDLEREKAAIHVLNSTTQKQTEDVAMPQLNTNGHAPDAAKTSTPKKSKVKRASEAAQVEAIARRKERQLQLEEELATLDNLTSKASRKSSTHKTTKHATNTVVEDDSDFGDETEMTAKEFADKIKRKKSLSFYTSQIAQKANKRGEASRVAGGDTDIPYRERFRDKQARLTAQAEKRGKKAPLPGEELGGASDDEQEHSGKSGNHAGRKTTGSDSDSYYDMMAAKTKQRKTEKKALVDAYKQAETEGGRVFKEETIGEDGRRKTTYAIQKNKGLAPSRKKTVRNPRVKQKLKFEKKKKKLASQKPMYKGGEGRGGYGGELTGIKTHTVKSVKF